MDDRAPLAEHGDIEASTTSVVIHRSIDELPEPQRTALVEWLRAHDLDPAIVQPRTALERCESTPSITWRQMTDDGIVAHRHFPPVTGDALWPAPFPPVLLTPALGAER